MSDGADRLGQSSIVPQARVFISCGQQPTEAAIAEAIAARLSALGFAPYIATKQQTLRGLKEEIFERLRAAEYFLFVDFKREGLVTGSPLSGFFKKILHRGSLFTHQELAIAAYLDKEVIAF